MLEIRNAVIIFSLREIEAMLPISGLPLTHQSMNDLLWVFLVLSSFIILYFRKSINAFMTKYWKNGLKNASLF